MPRETEFIHDSEPGDGPSKTQLKKQMTGLQELAGALLELPDAKLDQLALDERLRDALTELKRLKSHEARRRHMQYIGKLMRDAEAERLRQAVISHRQDNARVLQEAESWRERLLASDDEFTLWMAEHPGTDAQQLRALIRNTRREVAQARAADPEAGAAGSKGPFYRELFQRVRVGLKSSAEKPRG